jgi:hypothetical protein
MLVFNPDATAVIGALVARLGGEVTIPQAELSAMSGRFMTTEVEQVPLELRLRIVDMPLDPEHHPEAVHSVTVDSFDWWSPDE